MKLNILWLFVVLFLASTKLSAQQPSYNGTQIHKQLEKLGILNRVLYFAAHPDDENTRLIAYLSQGKNVETGYFSLTRGDGGQNLIGDEKGPLLGMIRTQELLEARKIDGGVQFFSRAIDFGYSKSAEETFKHWDREILLEDAVLVIRKFKPDVIVTRFPPDSRAGHGHHTVSAIIAQEAFKAAADASRFPESAKMYGTWKTTQLYWNESSWWNKNIADHKEDYVTVNIGSYDAQLGIAYSEIAAHSRSQHQSQGFGMAPQRGDKLEYLKFIDGDRTVSGVFQNEFRTWTQIDGGEPIAKQWQQIMQSYNAKNPALIVEELIQLYFAIEKMPSHRYQVQKAKDVKTLIAACSGLWLDFTASEAVLVQNQNVEFTARAISRSDYGFELVEVNINGQPFKVNKTLSNTYTDVTGGYPAPNLVSTPYWLRIENDNGLFEVADARLISQPENDPALMAQFVFATKHGDLIYERPLMYKRTDRVRGELYRPVAIVEPFSVEFDKKVSLALDDKIEVRVRANQAAKTIKVQLRWGTDQQFKSDVLTIDSLKAGQTLPLRFDIPNSLDKYNVITAFVWGFETDEYSKSLIEISYPHIQTQTVMPVSKLILIQDKIIVTRKNIGYINGSGDEIPGALEELGCEVTMIDPSQTSLVELKEYDGIVVGIRAYNKVEAMRNLAPLLNRYVYEGGFVMVQYNTNRGLVTDELGPYPFKLSRDRVTEEDAKVSRLQKNHPVLSTPNNMTDADFENWVQERGLYFADEWDEHYTPILGWNDSGEDLTKGSLLVAEYGEGHYVFTGISFFRQLPAGVLGAYKLFGNLLSYGRPEKSALPATTKK